MAKSTMLTIRKLQNMPSRLGLSFNFMNGSPKLSLKCILIGSFCSASRKSGQKSPYNLSRQSNACFPSYVLIVRDKHLEGSVLQPLQDLGPRPILKTSFNFLFGSVGWAFKIIYDEVAAINAVK
jgi:hypothetical protein